MLVNLHQCLLNMNFEHQHFHETTYEMLLYLFCCLKNAAAEIMVHSFEMELYGLFPTYFYLVFTNYINGLLAEFSSDDCASLGFNKANLLCSVCDQLSNFKLGALKESCFECCNKDDIPENTRKYAKARLEVCTCKFGAYPQIEAFIKSDRPSKFPNLSVRYVRGLDPIIKLMDKEGNVVETLAIDKWNTDSVEEFLKTYLESVNNVNLDYLQSNMV